jgi:hypothetical protein
MFVTRSIDCSAQEGEGNHFTGGCSPSPSITSPCVLVPALRLTLRVVWCGVLWWLQRIVVKMVDVSYGGENGFNQAIELSTEALGSVKLIQEKKLLQVRARRINMT